MSLRIVRREEVVEAFKEGAAIAAVREHVKEELQWLREWFSYSAEKKAEWGDPEYPLELIETIEMGLCSWPDPVTLDDLKG